MPGSAEEVSGNRHIVDCFARVGTTIREKKNGGPNQHNQQGSDFQTPDSGKKRGDPVCLMPGYPSFPGRFRIDSPAHGGGGVTLCFCLTSTSVVAGVSFTELFAVLVNVTRAHRDNHYRPGD